MSDSEEVSELATEPEDLKPKKPSNRAPQGIRAFTVCRQKDETGISGEGVVIEGVMFATGHTVIHWLTPAPRGSIAFLMRLMILLKYTSHLTQETEPLLRLKMENRLFMKVRNVL